MIYNLYLTKDYCSHWKKQHALKELITMILGENGTVTLRSNSCLVLETPKVLVSPNDALFGSEDPHPFDRLGEGVKLAILTLLRENTKFYFLHHLSGFTCLNFIFDFRKLRGLEEETLHVKVGHLYDHQVQGAIFEIHNVTEDELNQIYHLAEPEFMAKDKEKLKIELKQMETKIEMFNQEVEKVLSKVFSPKMRLILYIFYTKEEVRSWFEKDEIEVFVKQFLEKENIDIVEYTSDEKVYKAVMESIVDSCYNYCYDEHKYHKNA